MLNMPWCHLFSFPAFHFSQNGPDNKNIFSFLRRSVIFIICVHLWILGTSPNIDCLVSYNFIVNMSQVQVIYSPQSHHFTNQYKLSHICLIYGFFLYYYYIIQKLNVYQEQIQFLCLGRQTTYWSILPMVTKMDMLALQKLLYHTKVQHLELFWILKFLYLVLIESSFFAISAPIINKWQHNTHKLYYIGQCITSVWVYIPTNL